MAYQPMQRHVTEEQLPAMIVTALNTPEAKTPEFLDAFRESLDLDPIATTGSWGSLKDTPVSLTGYGVNLGSEPWTPTGESVTTLQLVIDNKVNKNTLYNTEFRRDVAEFIPGNNTKLLALKAAIAATPNGGILDLRGLGEIVFSEQLLLSNRSLIIWLHGTTCKLANNMIVNTDASNGNHMAILRQSGGYLYIYGGTFDGNRANQVYPTTPTIASFGRGTRCWRTNAVIENCPSPDNTTRGSLYLEGVTIKNGYLNGVVGWQSNRVDLKKCQFIDNTWCGFTGHGVQHLSATDNYTYRNGESAQYPQGNGWQEGDRSGIRTAIYSPSLTAASEQIPTIPFAIHQPCEYAEAVGNFCEEDAVEGIMFAATRTAKFDRNYCLNVGLKRPTTTGFFSSALWFEWGQPEFINNVVFTPNAPAAGCQQPDGITCLVFVGNGNTNAPFDGEFHGVVKNNQIFCGQTYAEGGDWTANSNKKVNHNRGMRINGRCEVAGNYLEGCVMPVQLRSGNDFAFELVREMTMHHNKIRNFTGPSAIEIERFDVMTNIGGRIVISDNDIAGGRTSEPATNNRGLIRWSTTMAGMIMDFVEIRDNTLDGNNVENPTLPYSGVRHRGATGSGRLRISGNKYYGNATAGAKLLQTDGGGDMIIQNNELVGAGRVFDISTTLNNTGRILLKGNTSTDMVWGVAFFGLGTNTIAEFIVEGNNITGVAGSTNGMSGLSAALASGLVAKYIAKNDNYFALAGTVLLKKPFAVTTPDRGAYFVGEINTSSDARRWLAFAYGGTGATDWSLLA